MLRCGHRHWKLTLKSQSVTVSTEMGSSAGLAIPEVGILPGGGKGMDCKAPQGEGSINP